MVNMKKENSKTWSEEAIDTLINCFQSHECLWNVTSGDYEKSLALEEADMAMQEYDMNRYDYQKKWTNLRGEFLRDYNRQNNSKKSGWGTDEVFQSTWKYYKRLEFLKSG